MRVDVRQVANMLKELEPMKTISIRFVPPERMPKASDGKRLLGIAEDFRNGKWRIRINNSQTAYEMIQCMIHEMAHVRTGIVSADMESDENHCKRFRRAEGEFYAAFQKWLAE